MACSCKVSIFPHCKKCSWFVCDHGGLTIAEKIVLNNGGRNHLIITCLRSGRPSHQKTRSPKLSSYYEEDNSDDVGGIMMYPLHYAGVKLIELKKKFGIKDDTTKNIHGVNIHNDPDMD